jgi:hypothetical protein
MGFDYLMARPGPRVLHFRAPDLWRFRPALTSDGDDRRFGGPDALKSVSLRQKDGRPRPPPIMGAEDHSSGMPSGSELPSPYGHGPGALTSYTEEIGLGARQASSRPSPTRTGSRERSRSKRSRGAPTATVRGARSGGRATWSNAWRPRCGASTGRTRSKRLSSRPSISETTRTRRGPSVGRSRGWRNAGGRTGRWADADD